MSDIFEKHEILRIEPNKTHRVDVSRCDWLQGFETSDDCCKICDAMREIITLETEYMLEQRYKRQ